MQTIQVEIKASPYRVLIGAGALRDAGALLLSALERAPSLVLLVSSPRVMKLHGKTLEKSLRAAKIPYKTISSPDGEQAKTLRTLEEMLRRFAGAKADRRACVLALGGGVTGDMAGFAAASFMRGIPVVQIPTTLLAQVDAAIGGKTGVNLPEGKNLVGAFHQPKLVICDPEVLSTLPQREFVAGMFEVLKTGFIRDEELVRRLELHRDAILGRDIAMLEEINAASVRVKAEVVAADEKEGDLRRILNFGHTVGHALESATNYKSYLHGEAVALGMLAAAYIAEAIEVSDSTTTHRIEQLVFSYAKLPKVKVATSAILKRIQGDKKTVDRVTHFVLVPRIGTSEIVSGIPPKIVQAAIERMKRSVNAQ